MYYAQFDGQGNRLASYHVDIHTNIPGDAIAISDEDQALYATNNYVRGADGKPQKKPAYVPTLDERKAAKLQQIEAWTASAITGGFNSVCTGSTVRFDSDRDTQITMQGIALNEKSERFIAEYPNGCPCRGYAEGATEKTVFWLSGEQVLGFCADLSAHIGTCKQLGWQLQAAVAAATTKEGLDLIVWPG